ncbi:hypothetical protein GCM10027285_08480 [Oleiagrimonas citrea]
MRLVKTVRNNPFHGGKHGVEDWDDKVRANFLVSTSITVLDQLAELGDFESDYKRIY